MTDTWTDTAGNPMDQIGVVVTDGPVYGARDAIGVVEGDTALKVVLTDTYEANDGTLQDSTPVFYPGTETYEDAAGNIHAVTTIGPIATVDFTGWSAGSEAGVYTDGETGGKFPTGCSAVVDGAIVTIDEATHDAGGVECVTVTIVFAGAGEFVVYFPAIQPAETGETWQPSVYIASIAHNVDEVSFGVTMYDEVDEILDDSGLGSLFEGLNQSSAELGEGGTAGVTGYVSVTASAASSATITMALKLEQIS